MRRHCATAQILTRCGKGIAWEVKGNAMPVPALIMLAVMAALAPLTANAQSVPSRAEAQALIEKHAIFARSVTQTFGLYRTRCVLMFDPDPGATRRYTAVALWQEDAGVLKVTRQEATNRNCGILAYGASIISIELTDAGRRQASSWPPRPINDDATELAMTIGQRTPDYNVPVQTGRFKGITGIAAPIPATGQVPVEFEYEFVSLAVNRTQSGRAIAYMRKYDTGWRLEKIEGFPEDPPAALLPASTRDIPVSNSPKPNVAKEPSANNPSSAAPRSEAPAATQIPSAPPDPSRIAGRSITRAVIGTDMIGDEPAGVGTTFTSQAARLFAYVEGRGMKSGDVVELIWVQPDGSTRGRSAVNVNGDAGRRLWYGYSSLTPRTPLPPGSWRVDVIVNGQFVRNIPFSVS